MTEPRWDFRDDYARLRQQRRGHLFDRALARVESEDAALAAARQDVEARALARQRQAEQEQPPDFGDVIRADLAGLRSGPLRSTRIGADGRVQR